MFEKRRKITESYQNKIGFNAMGVSFGNVIVRDVSPVDEFYFNESTSSDDSKKCIAYTDPIRMLFNQERLNQIGSTAVLQWMDSLKNTKKDPLAEVRSKCTDSQLKALIKSRHIQQPSELVAYAQWCNANLDEFTSELKKLEDANPTPSTEPTPSEPIVSPKSE